MFRRILPAILLTFAVVPFLQAQRVTFTPWSSQTGIELIRMDSVAMDLDLAVDAGTESGKFSIKQSRYIAKHETVLEWSSHATKKMRLVYDKVDYVEETPVGSGSKQPLPVFGRTYILTLQDSVLTIGAEDGRDLTAEESTFLRSDNQGGQLTFRFVTEVQGKSFSPGDTLKLPKDFFDNTLRAGPSPTIENASVTFMETRTVAGMKCGVFFVQMKATGDASVAVLEMNITGEFVLTLEGTQPVSLSMHGPVIASGADASMDLSGTGLLRMRSEYVYPSRK